MLVIIYLNKIVWFELYKILSCLAKMVNHFWPSFDAILEYVLVTETIVWCYKNIDLKTIIFQYFKNDGIPTRVTRLKVELNMADPISLNENLP